MESLNGIVRPFVTIFGFVCYTALIFTGAILGGIDWRSAIEVYGGTVALAIGFYFGVRNQAQ